MGSFGRHFGRWNVVSIAMALTAFFVSTSRAQVGNAGGALDAKTEARLLQAYRTRPLSFEKNTGQTDSRVRFLARQGSSTLFLTPDQAVISVPRRGGSRSPTTSFVAMTWLGANPSAPVEGVDELAAKTNYLIGSDPKNWRNAISTYARVQYRDIYPGVDLVYYGDQGHLEYDLRLAPGASTDLIRMKFRGAAKVDIDKSGDLVLKADGQEIRFHKPVAYQAGDSGRIPVEARFAKRGHGLRTGEVEFEVGDYDHSRPLILDPQLSYSSYLGGSGTDGANRVAVDTSGNAYIVGTSASTDFPVVAPYQSTNRGTFNVVVSKLNPEAAGASSLIYSTYLGGTGNNFGRAIAVDAMNHIYVAGDTNAANFPVTPGAWQTSCKLQAGACSSDAFAVKLDATGSTLLYSTYAGGTGSEFGFAIASDPAGNIILGVNTGSPDITVTPGAFQTTFAGGGAKYGDAWVAKLNPAGQGAADLLYATYLGGSGSEHLYALAIDGTGAICITGSTTSANFPVTPSAFSSTYSGAGNLAAGDAFVAKLNPAGQGSGDLVYSTYLGGSNDDQSESIALDSSNRIYITGFTESTSFPVTSATAFQATSAGGTCGGAPCAHGFVAKVDPSLSGSASLVYSTYLGGSNFDLGHGIALDSAGFVYVTGETGSTNFPVMNPIQSTCFGGCTPLPMDDVFIAKFDLSMPGASGLLFSTFLGGNDVDTGWSIGVDPRGNALVTGQTFSTNFPTLIPFQANCNNCASFSSSNKSGDAFLVKACITGCPTGSPSPTSLSFLSQSVGTTSPTQTVTFTNSGSGDLTVGSVTLTGANAAEFSQTNTCQAVLPAGAYCQINVAFTPAAQGNRVAAVSIVSNGGVSPLTISLSGTGAAPAVSLSASTLTFGNQNVNTSSAGQSVTVTNSGPGALTITGITITGANAGDYAQTNTCPATLAVNANCTVSLTFTPTGGGSRVATVAIADNGVSSPQQISLSGAGVVPGSSPWPNGYNYQATFTVAAGKAPGTQTNFPALLSGTYPDLKSSANGGRVLNSCAQTVGNRAIAVPCDLIFTSDAAGTAVLNWEVETYNPATGALIVWVNLPSVSSGTVVYGWYGNPAVSTLQYTPASTWNTNYVGIWHFSEDPSGAAPQLNDSTPGLSPGTSSGGMTSGNQVAGVVGGSLAFGGGRYVTFANPATFSFERTSPFTLEAWVKFGAKESSGILMKELVNGNFTGYGLFQRTGNTNSQIACELASTASLRAATRTNNEWTPGTFHHVACVYAGTSAASGITLYVDGVAQATTPISDTLNASILNTVSLEAAGRGGSTFLSSATIDEPRVSKTNLPAGWFAVEYNNQSSPAAFFTSVTGLTNQAPLAPVVSLSATSLNFGNQTVNATSASQNVTVTNSGPGALTIGTIAIAGSNASDYAQTNTCAATLAVNASCTVSVTFTPSAAGTRQASVSITDNGASSPQAIALSGTGALPAVTLSPAGLTFANQAVNTTSAAQNVTVTNNGPGTLTINGFAITGANAGDYTQTNTCPATLAVNATCTVSVTFTPTATGNRVAGVGITDNGASSPQTISLSGSSALPIVALSAATLTFSNQAINSTSAAQSVTVTNSGPGTLTIGGIAITGANAGDYAQTNNCPTTLAANANCTVSLTFTPTAAGNRAASVGITDNGASSPQTIALSGTGALPAATLSAASLTFPAQAINTPSAVQNVTLTNSGPGALTISAIAIRGANASDYAQTNNCPATLAANGNCTVSVTFTPTAAGNRAASVGITDNGVSSPQTIALSGTGALPTVSLSAASLTFATQVMNTTSAAQTVTLTNGGPGPLTISTIAISGANAGDYSQTNTCPTTLAANAICNISVTFTPTATGNRVAGVGISDNGASNPQTISLNGTGMMAAPSAWPNGYSYQAKFTVAAGKVPSAQTSFPVLISGTYPDFRSGANGGRVLNSCTQTVGNRSIAVPCDLIFTSDTAGTALVSWEIETYNPATGAIVAWVNLPSVSVGTVVYAWYGNTAVATLQYTPTSTWNGNYLGTWHLSEDPSGTAPQMNDSTPGFSPGTSNGGMAPTDQVPGVMGGSLAFGSGKYVTFSNPAMFSLERTSPFTLEAWVKFKAKESSGILMKEQVSGNFTGYGLFQRAGTTNSQIGCEVASTASLRIAVRTNNEWAPGTFHHVVCAYAGTSAASGLTLYVDGVAQPTTTLSDTLTGSILNALPLEVAGRGGATFLSTATIDEPRIAKVNLPAGWIAAEYNNQSSPATFFTAVTGVTPQ